MKEYIIRFDEVNVDGCGGNAEVMIMVRSSLDLTSEFKESLEKVIEEIKRDWDEWDTDAVVSEACKRIFGTDAEIYTIIPDIEIKF